MKSFYDFNAVDIEGRVVPMAGFRGQVVLLVNVASECGFTPQYKELEALFKKYESQGFVVLGFPCNQFGRQEPGSNAEIQKFCSLHFRTTFPMFSKVDVNGAATHPLFQFLKAAKPGLLGTQAIKWNFTKFLIDREGRVVNRFSPRETPLSFESSVRSLLDQSGKDPIERTKRRDQTSP